MKYILTLFITLLSFVGYSQITLYYNFYGDGTTTTWKIPIDTGYHSCSCLLLTSPTGSSGLAVSPALRIGGLTISDHNISSKDTLTVELYNIFNQGIPPYPLRVINRPAGYHVQIKCDFMP